MHKLNSVTKSINSCYLTPLRQLVWFDMYASTQQPTNSNQRTCPILTSHKKFTLQWRHNGHDGVSNHQPHDYLFNRLFGRRSKKTSKLRVTGLCVGNSPGTGEFPAQMSSNAENVSIWWRHHDEPQHRREIRGNHQIRRTISRQSIIIGWSNFQWF